MDYKVESIDTIKPLIDEIGEERFKQYMKAYLELAKDKHYFFEKFTSYIDQCKVNKNGYKIMSIMSFKNYILNMPSMEDLHELLENIEDPLDEYFGC